MGIGGLGIGDWGLGGWGVGGVPPHPQPHAPNHPPKKILKF